MSGVVGAIIAVAAVVLLVTQPWNDDHPTRPGPDDQVTTNLRHDSVEAYIQKNFAATDVTCHDGADIPIRKGATFTCTSTDGKHFDVTLVDGNGTYQVRQR